MFRFLVIAFIIVPIIEIYLILQVGSAIGGWETVGLLVLGGVVGAWLVRWAGFSILARVMAALGRGELPTNDLIDGMLVVVAGTLMLTPGFLTDALGFVLLIPPTRAVVRNILKSRFADRIKVGGAFGTSFGGRGFTDVRWTEERPTSRDHSTSRDHDGDNDPPGAIELGPASD